MSVATDAFALALERLAAAPLGAPERPPAFDVFRAGAPASAAAGALRADTDDAAATGASDAPGRSASATPANGDAPADATDTPLPADRPVPAIAAATSALANGETTSERLVMEALARIALDNDELVAFVEVLSATALAEARERDAELRAGRVRGPLHGIPISVKDVIHVAGVPTRAGSDALDAHPGEDAAAVALARAAGAVILGKTSTHEFALGVTSPQARNPHDRARIPGGSSGGSAIATALGMGLASIGTDTRASIRVPAALCGVVGLKPTFGTVPTAGMVPLSWTMDHVAVMAGSAADAATLLDALRPNQPSPAAAGVPVTAMRVGLPAAAWDGCVPEVAAAIDAHIGRLEGLVATVAPAARPSATDLDGANAMGLIVSRCEAAAFHRAAGLDRSVYWPEVRDQLDAADEVIAIDYIDAQRYRARLREELGAVFADHDVLAMPTTPVLAPRTEDADEYLTILSRNAIPWSFVGFPAISIPCPVDGLPVGLQLVAPSGEERRLIALATALEECTPVTHTDRKEGQA